MIIIKNARLINELTKGCNLDIADILIEGNKISRIEKCGVMNIDDAQVVDAKGKTVIPGLWDLHAHLSYRTQTANSDTIFNDVGEELYGSYDYSREYLKHGYTTIRDCGSAKETAIYLRNGIRDGYFKGPRILACGLIITPSTIGNKIFPAIYVEANSPYEVRKAARDEFAKGAEFLKFMATGAFMNKGGQPGLRIATEDEIKAVQEVAKLNNSYVAVHAHSADAVEMCIDAGIRTIEHASFINDASIKKLKDNENTFIVPTVSVSYIFLKATENMGENQFMTDDKRQLAIDSYKSLIIAYNEGIKLGWGSDIGMHDLINNPGLEFIGRKEMGGFENIDMLLQATRYSAEIAGFGDSVGTIEVDKIADIVIVDGNPDEDITVMCKKMINVIRDGELLI